ncbi:MAG TPA: S9 family peptidase [Bacteroidales bacterium]|nr:S9 family peptidase [Bacteroidales bacterium]
MKKIVLSILGTAILLLYSCNNKQSEVTQEEGTQSQIINQLTQEEKDGGVMTPELMWKFGRLGTVALSPDGQTVLYTVTNYDLDTQENMTSIYSMPSSGGNAVMLAGNGSSPQWIDNGNSIAYSSDGKLFTMKPDGSAKTTVEGLDNFEIFSISPKGDKLYFTRRVKLDQTANEKHNLPKAKVRIINDLMYRHWNAWSDYSYSHVFVASFNGSKVSGEKDVMEGQRFETPDSPYYDEGELSWSPDGKYVAYTSKKLTGIEYARSTNTDIYLYDTEKESEINITEENKGYDKYPVFSPDGSRIAYLSMEEPGYEADLNRLFTYDIKTGQRTWISKGWQFDIEEVKWIDNDNVYFTCSHMGTRQIFRIALTDGTIKQVTEGKHNLSPVDFKSGVLVAGLTSMAMAPEVAVVNTGSGEVKQISSINKFIYDFIKMGNSEEKYITTKDGMDLQMWVTYPPDFDASKKYPALLFCNGGPQSTLDQFWSYRWNMQMMAAKGYIVFAPNRRGVKGFGQEWTSQISGDYGGANIQDYLDATDAMAKEKYVDRKRMGAVGASYGGTSVFYLAGVHGGRFKAFISHNGMFDYVSWYGSTEELWFPNKDLEGPYWKSPKSYQYSPHLRVEDWDTPILIIAGQNDFRIPYTQAMEAFQAAQILGIPSRLLFFEDEYHFVTKPQNAVLWQREFFEWLDTYLK